MTKLTSHFTNFLDGTVNLNQSRLDTLDQRLGTIESFLTRHAEFGALMSSDELIPQGSYAHKTIIKPLPDHEYDVDALVAMHEQVDAEPRDYISQLYATLRSSGTYKTMVSENFRASFSAPRPNCSSRSTVSFESLGNRASLAPSNPSPSSRPGGVCLAIANCGSTRAYGHRLDDGYGDETITPAASTGRRLPQLRIPARALIA